MPKPTPVRSTAYFTIVGILFAVFEKLLVGWSLLLLMINNQLSIDEEKEKKYVPATGRNLTLGIYGAIIVSGMIVHTNRAIMKRQKLLI